MTTESGIDLFDKLVDTKSKSEFMKLYPLVFPESTEQDKMETYKELLADISK